MFVPVPVLIFVGLIFLLMIARIAGFSRRRDPLLGVPTAPFPRPAAGRSDAPVVILPPEIDLQVRAMIGSGRKVEAIKLVRDVTRLGLKDAKDLVEAL